MNILDVFNQDAFGMVSLTDSMHTLPYQPRRLGQMGLFTDEPIDVLSVAIESKDGHLSLLPTKARGAKGTTGQTDRRAVRTFQVPHIPHDDELLADDLIGKRAFDTADQAEVFSTKLNAKLEQMRRNFEVTHEWHRMGALHGQLLDADGSVIYDLFDEFGITEQVFTFNFSSATFNVLEKTVEIERAVEDGLGDDTYAAIHCLCGPDFFDALTQHETVKEAFKLHNNGNAHARESHFRRPFRFGNIMFEEYRGKIGSRNFIAPAEARFYPLGTGVTFKRFLAPANYLETVGTLGKLIYVKQIRKLDDTGIDIKTQSNPLTICRRPSVLKKGIMT